MIEPRFHVKHPEVVVPCLCGLPATVVLVSVTGFIIEMCPIHAAQQVDPLGALS